MNCFFVRFLLKFGSQGTADGKFNYPWGCTTDALGFIYVCDKENHRIQVRFMIILLITHYLSFNLISRSFNQMVHLLANLVAVEVAKVKW